MVRKSAMEEGDADTERERIPPKRKARGIRWMFN